MDLALTPLRHEWPHYISVKSNEHQTKLPNPICPIGAAIDTS